MEARIKSEFNNPDEKDIFDDYDHFKGCLRIIFLFIFFLAGSIALAILALVSLSQ